MSANQFGASSVPMAFATIIASALLKWTKWDNMYYGPIFTIINAAFITLTTVNAFDLWEHIDVSLLWYALAVPFVVWSVWFAYTKRFKRKTFKERKGTTIVIQNIGVISEFEKYIENMKEHYENPKYFQYGNYGDSIDVDKIVVIGDDKTLVVGEQDREYFFDDPNFNSKGYYEIKEYKKNVKESVAATKVYYKIHLEKVITYQEYINIIKAYNAKVTREAKTVIVKHYKLINPWTCIEEDIYRGPKLPMEVLYKRHLLTYFHPRRDELWEHVKNVWFHPEMYTEMGQSASAKYIFHGPAGTGKSTLPARFAMTLCIPLISVDILQYSKADLYYLFYEHRIQRPQEGKVGLIYSVDQKPAIIIDEFDIAMEEMHLRLKKKEVDITKHFKNFEEFLFLEGGEPKGDAIKEAAKLETKVASGPSISTLTSNSEVTPRDLLEVIEGPIPTKQTLVFATTNKLDRLLEICPELFREGRLTPVYIGHATRDTMKEISNFYFKQCQPDDLIPDVSPVPTSKLISVAMKYYMMLKKPGDDNGCPDEQIKEDNNIIFMKYCMEMDSLFREKQMLEK